MSNAADLKHYEHMDDVRGYIDTDGVFIYAPDPLSPCPHCGKVLVRIERQAYDPDWFPYCPACERRADYLYPKLAPAAPSEEDALDKMEAMIEGHMMCEMGDGEPCLRCDLLELVQTARSEKSALRSQLARKDEGMVETPRVCGNCKHGRPTSLDDTRCYERTPYLPVERWAKACDEWEIAPTLGNPRVFRAAIREPDGRNGNADHGKA